MEHRFNHADATFGETLTLETPEVLLDVVGTEGLDSLSADRLLDVDAPAALVAAARLGGQVLPTVVPPGSDGVIDRGGGTPFLRVFGCGRWTGVLLGDQAGEFSFSVPTGAVDC
jgi:hypothetical protein